MSEMIELKEALLENVSLADYTTWRVGGTARYLYKPKSVEDLAAMLNRMPKSLPVVWLGLGSNTLVSDDGFDGLVVLTQGNLNQLVYDKNSGTVYVEAGVSCAKMARFCARENLAECEFWAGIPGTMGGALRMNAGCFNGETWQHVISVTTLNRFGELKKKKPQEFDVSYRMVKGLDENEWFVGAEFLLPKGDKSTALANIKALLEARRQTQPTGEYNCGSVFKNPTGDFAARLIEACGLKGFSIGGASVSEKHANFIINHGDARAEDIRKIIDHVANAVKNNMGISLVPEVQLWP